MDLEDEERKGAVNHRFQAWVTGISLESGGYEALARYQVGMSSWHLNTKPGAQRWIERTCRGQGGEKGRGAGQAREERTSNRSRKIQC